MRLRLMLFAGRAAAMIALVAATSLWLAACQSEPKTSDHDVQRLTYEQVRELMADTRRGRPVLVDVRPSGSRRARTIEGSLHIPLQTIISNDRRLAGVGHIIVFGTDFQDDLSSAGAKRLIERGYSNVYDYRGGVLDWDRNGGAVVPVPVEP